MTETLFLHSKSTGLHFYRLLFLVLLVVWWARQMRTGLMSRRGDCDNWPRSCSHRVPCPLTSKSQRQPFQFNTGFDQISPIAGLRYIFDTFTLEAFYWLETFPLPLSFSRSMVRGNLRAVSISCPPPTFSPNQPQITHSLLHLSWFHSRR